MFECDESDDESDVESDVELRGVSGHSFGSGVRLTVSLCPYLSGNFTPPTTPANQTRRSERMAS